MCVGLICRMPRNSHSVTELFFNHSFANEIDVAIESLKLIIGSCVGEIKKKIITHAKNWFEMSLGLQNFNYKNILINTWFCVFVIQWR